VRGTKRVARKMVQGEKRKKSVPGESADGGRERRGRTRAERAEGVERMGGYRTAHSYVQPFVGFFTIGGGGGGERRGGDGRTPNLSTDRQQDLRTARTLSGVISRRRSVRLPRSADSNPGLRPDLIPAIISRAALILNSSVSETRAGNERCI